ncbi:uncharacterized protein K489DRAFT_222307 [Dissoconium aciculare CBS 342.82]|uniref:Uncharacterized protein n=1 Tax=Dissoconium aciculare CBS 342.82 TaxID=1314786 RepID=A0A6J3M509_9PEZI|nr:uncharacterized protein K489DRAFT_222307 [Dissoconium aciculare CBS 342.82]KAF1822983.1 hypothetical protein K489DRAFT_222307 [Dissoconium aciculare CBS 342.82]
MLLLPLLHELLRPYETTALYGVPAGLPDAALVLFFVPLSTMAFCSLPNDAPAIASAVIVCSHHRCGKRGRFNEYPDGNGGGEGPLLDDAAGNVCMSRFLLYNFIFP